MTVPNESEAKKPASSDGLAKEIISDVINNILMQEQSAQEPSEVQIFDNAYTSTPDEQANIPTQLVEEGGHPPPPSHMPQPNPNPWSCG